MNSQQAQRNWLYCNNKLDLNAGFTGVRIKFGMENFFCIQSQLLDEENYNISCFCIIS